MMELLLGVLGLSAKILIRGKPQEQGWKPTILSDLGCDWTMTACWKPKNPPPDDVSNTLWNIWGIPGKTVWKCLLLAWLFFRMLKEGVKMLTSSQSLWREELSCQRLCAGCRTFEVLCNIYDMNLSESSSICPILISHFFSCLWKQLWYSCPAECLSSFFWGESHGVYSFSFKQNKLAQPKGLWRFAPGGTCLI